MQPEGYNVGLINKSINDQDYEYYDEEDPSPDAQIDTSIGSIIKSSEQSRSSAISVATKGHVDCDLMKGFYAS